MSGKKKLFSIGDVSKLTGATIKALRYYDRIKILQPAYVDPETSYRYYTYNQIYLLEIIMLCIELDIPLKKLTEFMNEYKTIDYSSLLTYGKEIAEEKLKQIKRGLQFISSIEQKIEKTKELPSDDNLYTRHINEKYFYVVPYKQTFENMDEYEVSKLFLEVPYDEDDYNGDWLEYGYMCEFSASGINRYAFVEVPKGKVKKKNPNYKTIPAGEYHCRHGGVGQIEQSKEIFNDYISGKDSFIAIETEVFSGEFNIEKSKNEVRVIKSVE